MDTTINRIMLFFVGILVFIGVFYFLNNTGWDETTAEKDKGQYQQITEMVKLQNESRSPKYQMIDQINLDKEKEAQLIVSWALSVSNVAVTGISVAYNGNIEKKKTYIILKWTLQNGH